MKYYIFNTIEEFNAANLSVLTELLTFSENAKYSAETTIWAQARRREIDGKYVMDIHPKISRDYTQEELDTGGVWFSEQEIDLT